MLVRGIQANRNRTSMVSCGLQLLGLEAWLQNQDTLLSSPLKPRSESPMRPQQPQQQAPATPSSSPPLRGPSTPGGAVSGAEYPPTSSASPWSSPTRLDLGAAAAAGNGSNEFRPTTAGAYAGTLSGSPAFQRATQALAAAQAALAAGPGLGSRPGTVSSSGESTSSSNSSALHSLGCQCLHQTMVGWGLQKTTRTSFVAAHAHDTR